MNGPKIVSSKAVRHDAAGILPQRDRQAWDVFGPFVQEVYTKLEQILRAKMQDQV